LFAKVLWRNSEDYYYMAFNINVIVCHDQIINVHVFTLWNIGQRNWFLLYGPSLRKAPSRHKKKNMDLSVNLSCRF